jgi:hypothetical protein
MKIVTNKISISELKEMSFNMLGNLVKAVVDIEKEIIVLDAELHSDQEALLLKEGSRQEDLWGINIYPDLPASERIEFDSMINLRPSQNNRTRGIDSLEIKHKIMEIVHKIIEEK